MLSKALQQDWIPLSDLQSYSFDGFQIQNQYSIDRAKFEVNQSVEHHHLFNIECIIPHTSQNLNQRIDYQDSFYFEESLSEKKELMINHDQRQHHSSSQNHEERVNKITKIKKERKSKRNQYDKNIFANIMAVVLKKMVNHCYQKDLKYYCQCKQANFEQFKTYFTAIQRSKQRLGTTQIANFYSNTSIPQSLKKVFSLFLVGFLQKDYVQYIMRQGKMTSKQKYLRCATKMMYIPSLRKEEYSIISNLRVRFEIS